MNTIQADKELDCCGMLCPLPVVKTAQAIKQIDVGQVLKMISTDAGAPADMEAWCRQTGHEMMVSSQEDDKYIFYFRRTK